MRKKLGITSIILGTALILGALALFLYNQHQSDQAGVASNQVLEQLETALSMKKPGTYPDPYDPAMTVVEVDGYGYIGYLTIPALELELPVMSQWDYKRLNISPCYYSGSTKTDDLVLCAHNYSHHFGRISQLVLGDQVYFTDMDGRVWEYTVVASEVLTRTAVEDMNSGEYDLSLFTCTYGGASRVTVRCDRTVESQSYRSHTEKKA